MLVSSWLIGLDTEPLHSDKVPTMRSTLQRSPAQPQQPNGVCRLGRPKAHEVGLPGSRHRWLPQLRMRVPLRAYGYDGGKKRGRMSAMPVGDQDFGRLLALHFCPFWAETT